MAAKITRRSLAGIVAGTSLAAQAPPAPKIPATPDEELAAARAQLRSNAAQIAKVVLPMSTEPATLFKA